jgi:hypothetical protein
MLLGLPLVAAAEVYELKPGLKVALPEVPAPWTVSREPVPALVEHIAEHLQEEAAEKGRALPQEQAQTAARQRLQANELFVFNQESGAHLLVSFEALREGEKAPSAKAIAQSAKYAAEGVTDEGWTDVTERQAATAVKGAQLAQWFEIGYTHEGQRSVFMGIVGFARPYWFWLYANDHQRSPDDRAVLEKLLRELEIRVEP